MKIVSVIKDSFQEFENHQSIVLFSYGCNLRCKECYNLRFVSNPDNIIGEAIPLIESNLTPIHDAVVFLGGEPTIHSDLPEILEYVKSKGLLTKIFTNGLNPKMIKLINNESLVDAYSVDFKTLNPEILGVNLWIEEYIQQVDQTLRNIISHKIPLEIRTTRWDNIYLPKIQEYVGKIYPHIPHLIQDKFILKENDETVA